MLRIDFHVHTSRSDGKMKVLTAVRIAISRELDGIAITDHDVHFSRNLYNEIKRKYPDFVIIPGIEVSSADGHILVLGTFEPIPPKLSAEETIEIAHELGGIAVPAHPFDRLRDGIGEDKLLKLLGKYDAIEAVNGSSLREIYNRKALKFAKKYKIPIIGGSDAHVPDLLGVVITFVDASNSIDDVLSAIKKSKTRVYYQKIGFFKLIMLRLKKYFTRTI